MAVEKLIKVTCDQCGRSETFESREATADDMFRKLGESWETVRIGELERQFCTDCLKPLLPAFMKESPSNGDDRWRRRTYRCVCGEPVAIPGTKCGACTDGSHRCDCGKPAAFGDKKCMSCVVGSRA